jgi:hypothetical protein
VIDPTQFYVLCEGHEGRNSSWSFCVLETVNQEQIESWLI